MRFTNKLLAIKMQQEGLDYLIMHYVHPNDVEDPEVRSLFEQYRVIAGKILEKLEPYCEEY